MDWVVGSWFPNGGIVRFLLNLDKALRLTSFGLRGMGSWHLYLCNGILPFWGKCCIGDSVVLEGCGFWEALTVCWS